jgi:hypothetical protein
LIFQNYQSLTLWFYTSVNLSALNLRQTWLHILPARKEDRMDCVLFFVLLNSVRCKFNDCLILSKGALVLRLWPTASHCSAMIL